MQCTRSSVWSRPPTTIRSTRTTSDSTAIWSGSLDSDFRAAAVTPGGRRFVGGLAAAVSRGLSLSMSGYPFSGSEIGGSTDVPSTELWLRWISVSALGTIMRIDSSRIDADTGAGYRTYAELHMQLNPLLWTLALQAGRDGTPVTRPAKFMYDCAL